MINPGGTPGTSFNKSAQTRFNNNQINAARASMPFNQAAQQSLRNMHSGAKASGPPVGPQTSQGDPLAGMQPPTPQVELPTGGPQLPMDQTQQFDPEVFKENMVNEIAGQIRTQQFLNSPRVKDAATSVRLKHFFNNTNPQATPDSRNLLDQVMSRLRTP